MRIEPMKNETVELARDRLLKEIRDCIAYVRCDSSSPVGDCSTFVDALITALSSQQEMEHDDSDRVTGARINLLDYHLKRGLLFPGMDKRNRELHGLINAYAAAIRAEQETALAEVLHEINEQRLEREELGVRHAAILERAEAAESKLREQETEIQRLKDELSDLTTRHENFKANEARMRGHYLLKLEVAEAQIVDLHAENMCDACGGNGTPTSGLPCMCNGTGRMSDAARNLRLELLKADTEARMQRISDRLKERDSDARNR